MTLNEFNALYEQARALPDGEAKTNMLKSLAATPVVDDKGNPVKIEVREVTPAAPAPAPAPAMSAKDIDAAIQKGIAEGIKALAPKPDPHGHVIADNAKIAIGSAANPKIFAGNREQQCKTAYQWGQFARAAAGIGKAAEWCNTNGLRIEKAQSEGVNSAGGVLVPEELAATLIDLREQYGVFRRNARVMTMGRDTLSIPRRVSGLTVYWPGEGGTVTDSTKAFDSVKLTARKPMMLAKYSTELMEDAIIDIGADLAREIAWQMSYTEDLCGFIGDGTSTYGGIVGLSSAMVAKWTSTTSDTVGVQIAAGNTIAEIVVGDFQAMVGSLPLYARRGAKWYCSAYVHENAMERIAQALGGATASIIRAGSEPRFLGYPVELVQVMPASDTNSQMLAYFGDLTLAATLGDRRQIEVTTLKELYAASGQVGILASQRFDIQVHDVGDGTTVGPIVGLRAAAS